MTNNPSDRAMKCANVVYDHFISFPIRRQDDHQKAMAEVARIIDRHFGELADALRDCASDSYAVSGGLASSNAGKLYQRAIDLTKGRNENP